MTAPSDCDGCDCPCINDNVTYGTALYTVKLAAYNVALAAYNTANSELTPATTFYYYWLMQAYACSCDPGLAPKSGPPVTAEMLKVLMLDTQITALIAKRMKAAAELQSKLDGDKK